MTQSLRPDHSGAWELYSPGTTEHAAWSGALALVAIAASHDLIRDSVRITLLAGLRSLGTDATSRLIRGEALRLLAINRQGWEPDTHDGPRTDLEIGQVARVLSLGRPLTHAWPLLCEGVDERQAAVVSGALYALGALDGHITADLGVRQ